MGPKIVAIPEEVVVANQSINRIADNVDEERHPVHAERGEIVIGKVAMEDGGMFLGPTGDVLSETQLIRQGKNMGILAGIQMKHVEAVASAEIVGDAGEGRWSGFRDAIVKYYEVSREIAVLG